MVGSRDTLFLPFLYSFLPIPLLNFLFYMKMTKERLKLVSEQRESKVIEFMCREKVLEKIIA